MSYKINKKKGKVHRCPQLIKTHLQHKRATPILSAATSTASSDRLIVSLPYRSNSPATSTRTVTSQFEIDDERRIVLTPCRILRLSINPLAPPMFSLMYLPIKRLTRKCDPQQMCVPVATGITTVDRASCQSNVAGFVVYQLALRRGFCPSVSIFGDRRRQQNAL